MKPMDKIKIQITEETKQNHSQLTKMKKNGNFPQSLDTKKAQGNSTYTTI